MTTYFVEERSGVIGLGPIAHPPEMYFRRTRTNWASITTWIHLIICLLAIPLIIWNLYHLLDSMIYWHDITPQEKQQYTEGVHILALLVIFTAICMNLIGGLFALVTEAACFSEKVAKLFYVCAYLSIAISICALLISNQILNILALVLLILFIIMFGFGFWRFTIISAIYLNEEGPVWFKPLLYFCLAAIPLLQTSSQCRDTKNVYGCLPNYLFVGRYMYNDYYSFTIMIIISLLSVIPFLLGINHIE